MVGNLIIGLICITIVAPLAWRAFLAIRTGNHPRDTGSTGNIMPPSGPDIGGGITGI